MPLIVLEGIDGTGKTTLQRQLVNHYNLTADGPVLAARFPGDEHTTLGPAVRSILFNRHIRKTKPAEVLLFAADMANTIEETIVPALNRGLLVIADRWTHSTLAYQNARASMPPHGLRQLVELIERDLTPDGVIYMHPPEPADSEWVETCYRRAQDGNQYEAAGLEFQKQVSGWYRHLAGNETAPHAEINPTLPPYAVKEIAVRFINDVLDGNTGPYTVQGQ